MATLTIRTQDVKRDIARNPGSTCVQIADRLELPTLLVRVALQELRASGAIKASGRTRGTTYTLTGKRA